MGTINYKQSDFITLGLELFDSRDFEDESGKVDHEAMRLSYEDARESIEAVLSKYAFYYFHVTTKPGYYEGFTLDIEENFGLCYDCYADKLAALKEVTQLKKLLLECADNGLCEIHPGWVTTYRSHDDTVKGIRAAIKELREIIKSTPTYTVLERQGVEF